MIQNDRIHLFKRFKLKIEIIFQHVQNLTELLILDCLENLALR